MTPLEHFYIRHDKKTGHNGWPIFYTALNDTQKNFDTFNCDKPAASGNKAVLEITRTRLQFLDKLLTEQQLYIADFNDKLVQIINVTTSLLSLYDDDDEIGMITAQRMREIHGGCQTNFKTLLITATDQQHRQQAKASNEVNDADEKDETALSNQEIFDRLDDKDIPVLAPDATMDNLKDAMRVALQRMRSDEETREETEAIVLTPQERMFLEIQREIEKSISNLSTAVQALASGKTFQFANGLLALQGRFDRKGLSGLPHSLIQIGNLRLSNKVSDNMTPTLFLHAQRFAAFRFPRKASPAALAAHVEMIRDQVVHTHPDRTLFLQQPLRHRLFPGVDFLWFPERDTVMRLELPHNIKAELPL